MNDIRKNLFKLEEEEFENVEKPMKRIMKDTRNEEKIKIYPEKKIDTKRNKIKVSKNPNKQLDKEKEEFFDKSDNIELEAEEYPGEIVKSKNNYFISLQENGNFKWFLLK